jgi:hypothetical protein
MAETEAKVADLKGGLLGAIALSSGSGKTSAVRKYPHAYLDPDELLLDTPLLDPEKQALDYLAHLTTNIKRFPVLGGSRGTHTMREKHNLARHDVPYFVDGADSKNFSPAELSKVVLGTSVHGMDGMWEGKPFSFRDNPIMIDEITDNNGKVFALVRTDKKTFESFLKSSFAGHDNPGVKAENTRQKKSREKALKSGDWNEHNARIELLLRAGLARPDNKGKILLTWTQTLADNLGLTSLAFSLPLSVIEKRVQARSIKEGKSSKDVYHDLVVARLNWRDNLVKPIMTEKDLIQTLALIAESWQPDIPGIPTRSTGHIKLNDVVLTAERLPAKP